MSCDNCNANIIRQSSVSCGGFLCSNDHILCVTCASRENGGCIICQKEIVPIEINVNVRPKQIAGLSLAKPKQSSAPSSCWANEMIHDWSQMEKHQNISQESMVACEHFPESTSSSCLNLQTNFNSSHDGSLNGTNRSRDDEEEADSEENLQINSIERSRFSGSMKNYYQCDTQDKRTNCESLTRGILRDCPSIADANDGMLSYLKRLETSADTTQNSEATHFPLLNFNRNLKTPNAKNSRSISVSTDSNPTLDASQKDSPSDDANKTNMEYIVMHVSCPDKSTEPVPIIEKDHQKNLDLRLQNIIRTFHEDHVAPVATEKQRKFQKMPCETHKPFRNEVQQIDPLVHWQPCPTAGDYPTSEIESLQSNSRRAFYNPPGKSQSPLNLLQLKEPMPQFQLISMSTVINDNSPPPRRRGLEVKAFPAKLLNIPRSPILCPDSSCQRSIFVSDFNKHMVVDHTKIPMERIGPLQCRNFFIDPKLSHCGQVRCHFLYLVTDKIQDLGSGKFKDYLPLLVMSSRVRLSQICRDSAVQFAGNSDEPDLLMIWLTGIVPPDLPVYVSLTVWPRSGESPKCHLVHSGQLYSIRNSQDVCAVWRNGQVLLLSSNEVKLLTNGGCQMLELQIVVH